MVVYLTNHFFNEGHRRQAQQYPFKIKYMNTISRFQEHIQHYDDLTYYFDGRVHYCKLIYEEGYVLTLQ